MKYITHVPTVKDVLIWMSVFLLLILIPFFGVLQTGVDHPLTVPLVAILTFFLFNIIIRKNLLFKNYFLSPYNLFTTKSNQELIFPLSRDLMFEKMIEVIKDSKFKLVASDAKKHQIFAVSKISWWSWGENLYIHFKDRGDETVVTLCSVTLFQITSWGKNQKNHQALLDAFEDSLTI
jgi:hypothetical protein